MNAQYFLKTSWLYSRPVPSSSISLSVLFTSWSLCTVSVGFVPSTMGHCKYNLMPWNIFLLFFLWRLRYYGSMAFILNHLCTRNRTMIQSNKNYVLCRDKCLQLVQAMNSEIGLDSESPGLLICGWLKEIDIITNHSHKLLSPSWISRIYVNRRCHALKFSINSPTWYFNCRNWKYII